ncbi:hypothetical protein SPRG_18745, partial [Saprolegnia parasitica CBS 223.65]
EAVATYCRNVEFALKHVELDPSLSCTPECDELVGVLGDLHSQFRHETISFRHPTSCGDGACRQSSALPSRRQKATGWDAQNASLMDDTNDLVEDLDDLLGASPVPEQPTTSLKDMREKLGHSYDESLQDDAALISSVADRAQANFDKLDSENARFEAHLNNGLTVWKMLLLLGLVFVVFIGMYRVFTKQVQRLSLKSLCSMFNASSGVVIAACR